jgi:ubiquinone/menaquinone biosynthesis C-methylase UbiE
MGLPYDDRWMCAERRYLPAASLHLLLPAYDPIMKLLRFQRALGPLVAQAGLQPSHRVLDIGCGTGTLAVMIARAHPAIEVTGVDPDPRALARAVRKAGRAGVAVRFDRGFADALAYANQTFDRVFSSMMLHHVPRAEKPGVLAEARRVLKPGGRLELLDFAGGTHALVAHVLHGRRASASADERLLRLLRDAGFADARRLETRPTIAGAIAYYQAVRS